MINLENVGKNKVDDRYVVPVMIDKDYSYDLANDNSHVDLTVEIGEYAGMVVRVPLGGLGLLTNHKQQRTNEFHYDYTLIKMWDSATQDKFDGKTVTLDIKDQTFLHCVVFNFFDNIKKGNVRGLKLVAG